MSLENPFEGKEVWSVRLKSDKGNAYKTSTGNRYVFFVDSSNKGKYLYLSTKTKRGDVLNKMYVEDLKWFKSQPELFEVVEGFVSNRPGAPDFIKPKKSVVEVSVNKVESEEAKPVISFKGRSKR